jgi:uncharacterized oxidoreductase
MNTKGNTILITGGATGIGFSLAEHAVKAGNRVIICGRRQAKLRDAKRRLPQIHIKKCDLSKAGERKKLHDWVVESFRDVNILVNNAGIQRIIDLKKGMRALAGGEDEIEVTLKACVHMAGHFIPDFLKRKESAVVNVSSGLAFVPMAIFPVYCATKAALHSFSVSLRHQLRKTPVRVFEIVPPMVDTELDRGARGRRGQEDRGIPPFEVAAAFMKALERDEFEVLVGQAHGLRTAEASGHADKIFQNMNMW